MTTNYRGEQILLSAEAKLGDYTIVFTDDEEQSVANLKDTLP